MTRRLEAGPLLVVLGAVLLLVSLFLSWYTAEISAWQAFEVWDLVLFLLAFAGIAIGLGLALPDLELLDRRVLAPLVAAVAVIVAAQIIDPPPAARGQDPMLGAWLALGAAVVMCIGAVLTFGRVHLAFTVEGHEVRQHVSAVDARREDTGPTAGEPGAEAARSGAARGSEPRGERLFHRYRDDGPDTTDPPASAGGDEATTRQDERPDVGADDEATTRADERSPRVRRQGAHEAGDPDPEEKQV